MLELNYRELIEDGLREFKRGNAKLWLADQLSPTWASRPERTLADVLKIEPRQRIEFLASQLRKVGIRDLDQLSPPNVTTGE